MAVSIHSRRETISFGAHFSNNSGVFTVHPQTRTKSHGSIKFQCKVSWHMCRRVPGSHSTSFGTCATERTFQKPCRLPEEFHRTGAKPLNTPWQKIKSSQMWDVGTQKRLRNSLKRLWWIEPSQLTCMAQGTISWECGMAHWLSSSNDLAQPLRSLTSPLLPPEASQIRFFRVCCETICASAIERN